MARKKKKIEENLPQVVESLPAVIPQGDEPTDIVAFAENLLLQRHKDVSIKECFLAATDIASYMAALRNKGLVLGSKYVGDTINSIGTRAANGHVDSAKFLFNFLGLTAIKKPITVINNENSVNLTLKDIIDVNDFTDEGDIIDV